MGTSGKLLLIVLWLACDPGAITFSFGSAQPPLPRPWAFVLMWLNYLQLFPGPALNCHGPGESRIHVLFSLTLTLVQDAEQSSSGTVRGIRSASLVSLEASTGQQRSALQSPHHRHGNSWLQYPPMAT